MVSSPSHPSLPAELDIEHQPLDGESLTFPAATQNCLRCTKEFRHQQNKRNATRLKKLLDAEAAESKPTKAETDAARKAAAKEANKGAEAAAKAAQAVDPGVPYGGDLRKAAENRDAAGAKRILAAIAKSKQQ